MEILVICAVIGLIPAIIASNKGRSFFWWWIYGTFLFLIALVHSAVLKPRELTNNSNTRVCPFCAESVKLEAKVCKHCHKELPEVTEEQKAKPASSKSGLIIAIVIVVGFFLLVGYISSRNDNASNLQTKVSTNQVSTEVKSFSGAVLGYDYEVLYNETEQRYVANFSPFLPRNDDTLQTVMSALVEQVYGETNLSEPELVEKNNINLINTNSNSASYYFMPIKEDTGEIHSLVFWTE